MTERESLIALTHFVKFGPAGLKKLYARLGSWHDLWSADSSSLNHAGLDLKIATEFVAWRTTFNIEHSWKILDAEKIQIVCETDDNYPEPLRNISQPPLVLYYQGKLRNSLWSQALAVVGSRKYTRYGERVIEDLIRPVARAGITIVSGLALGIDALAHQATLHENGITVGVLGSGLDQNNLYPATNRRLGQAIIDHGGLLISEFAPGTPGFKFNFPRRNRIIAGLTQGTLVIEANIKSGSLITANYALDANREVMAVPNSIYAESSSGTNHLLQMGAKLVTTSNDILEVLNFDKPLLDPVLSRVEGKSPIEKQNLEPIEQAILEALRGQEKSINDLTKELKLDISQINARLSLMEINGLVRSAGPATFTATKRL